MSYIGKFKSSLEENKLYRIGSTLFGVCKTPANESEKEIVMPDFDSLISDITIYVLFTETNTASNVKFKFVKLGENGEKESTGANLVNVYISKTEPIGNTPVKSWQAESIVSFTYYQENGNAGKWIMNSSNNVNAIIAHDGILDMS